MGYIIALAGKGGTGKTTIAALLVRIIKEEGLGSVLAVDADPNSNLSEALGMESKETIGRILDDIAAHPDKIPSGMTKDRFIEYQVQSAVAEGMGYDILTMGKPEGPGCYCYVNNVLRNIMAKLIKDYDYVVIDNEAGLEHLSRRTTRTADCLLIISDATVVGIKAAERIKDLADELDVKIKKRVLIINRVDRDIEKERLRSLKTDYAGFLPCDNQIEKISLNGNSMLDLKDDAVSLTNLRKIVKKIFQES